MAIAIVASTTLLLPLSSAAYEVISFSKTGDAIAGGSSSGDENPFEIDILAEADHPPFNSSATSQGRVELAFRLIESAVIRLEGELALLRTGYGSAQASLMLSNVSEPAGSTVLFEASFAGYPTAYDECSYDPPCDPPVDFQQTLPPGDYALIAEAVGTSVLSLAGGRLVVGTGGASVLVTMTRLPVPEPSSGLSLLMGLGLLAARVSRR